MLAAIRGLWDRLRAWWAAQEAGWQSINGDNREGDWSEPDPPEK